LQGREVEAWLEQATGTQVFSLTGGIKMASGIPIAPEAKGPWAWSVGLFVKERKLRSHHRIDIFYGVFGLAFLVLSIVFYAHATKSPVTPSRSQVSSGAFAPDASVAATVAAPVCDPEIP
jgi:hypothetical protein